MGEEVASVGAWCFGLGCMVVCGRMYDLRNM
jgi:hypothetical protein